MRILLKLLCQFVHLLRCLYQALTFSKVIYLFCSCTLSDLLNLINLVLSFCDSTHLNSCVIVVIDSAEVRAELFVEDAWAQVLLALNELQVVCVVGRDCFVHLIEEALRTLWAVASAGDKTNENDVEEHMALKRGATRHRLHAHFIVAIP